MKKIFASIILIVMMTIFLAPNISSAQDSVANETALRGSVGMYSIAYIGARFVVWGADLVNWTINLNGRVLDNPAVKIGWPVSRDIANLGFVFAIIVIAFSTILQYESYHMQKTLFRLIWVALLINFSLVIAAVFIDFSSVLTNYFINKITTPDKMALILANAIQVQKIATNNPDPSMLQQAASFITGGLVGGTMEFMANLFFVIFFTAIAAISMFGLAFMMFIRYLWLVFLLTLAPLAWLAHAWPDLDRLWGQWWNQFFKYIWFAPAMSFFIYLAISVVEGGASSSDPNFSAAATGLGASGLQVFSFDATGETIGKMLTVLGILYGGMYTANAAGIYGAAATVKVAGGFKDTVTGYTKSKTLGVLDRASVGINGKTIRENLRGATNKQWLNRVPFVGGALEAADKALSAGGKKTLEAFDSDNFALSKEARINKFLRGVIDPEERASLMGVMAKNNELKDIESDVIGKESDPSKKARVQEKYENYLRDTMRTGGPATKLIIARNPFMARFKAVNGSVDDQRKEVMSAKLTNEAAANIDLKQLQNEFPEFLEKFSSNHITAFATADGRSTKDMNDLAELFESQINKLSSMIESEADGAARGELESRRSRLAATASFINKSPAWGGRQVNPDMLDRINPNQKKKDDFASVDNINLKNPGK